MAAIKSFEDGLMEVEEKLEEIFTRFQKCCTQVRQKFSLRSDQNNKNTDYFKEFVKEDSSKTEAHLHCQYMHRQNQIVDEKSLIKKYQNEFSNMFTQSRDMNVNDERIFDFQQHVTPSGT
nr:hypothetical protein [Tanacetum cinerariifolium]